MVRLPLFLLLLVAAAALPAWAQIQPRSLQTIDDPKGEFSLSLRFSGHVEVNFRDIGTLGTGRDIGDQSSEANRFYDDGYVLEDARTTSNGQPLPDDGKTNTWRMGYVSQIIDEDGNGLDDGIAFHRYQTQGAGASMDAESTAVPGLDLDYAYSLGRFGGRLANKSPRATWGVMAGLTLTSVNAKSQGDILVTLITDEDRYSLDGATPPTGPYTGPSSETTTTTDADGNTVSYVADTTTLLANRPYSRYTTTEPEGATVQGYWQVRGGAITGRGGLWMRYRPFEKLALRANVGVNATFLGLEARYDEWLDKEELLTQLRHKGQVEPDKWTYFGAFGSLDAEWWLTGSSALFVGMHYEQANEEIKIPMDGRTADIRIGSGTGFRIGITKLF